MGIKGFEERLTNARKEKGYTQEELASKLGVTPQAVSKWERGMGYPDLETLLYLSELLECSVDYLLHREIRSVELAENGDEEQRKRIFYKLLAEPVVIEFGEELLALLEEESRSEFQSIRSLREKLAEKYGILLPLIRITDHTKLDPLEYRILAYDKVICSSKVQDGDFRFCMICDSLETVCLNHYDRILNRQLLQTLIDHLREKYPAVIEGVIPEKISLSLLQKVLPGVLRKQGSIRNLVKIIEILEEEVLHTRDAEELTELIMKHL